MILIYELICVIWVPACWGHFIPKLQFSFWFQVWKIVSRQQTCCCKSPTDLQYLSHNTDNSSQIYCWSLQVWTPGPIQSRTTMTGWTVSAAGRRLSEEPELIETSPTASEAAGGVDTDETNTSTVTAWRHTSWATLSCFMGTGLLLKVSQWKSSVHLHQILASSNC